MHFRVLLWDCSRIRHISSKVYVMQHIDCAVWSCPAGPTYSQFIISSQSERQASLLPLAHLAAWWLLLICPQASVSTSPIWTRIKGPNTNSCAGISHVSIYSYFVNQCTTHTLLKWWTVIFVCLFVFLDLDLFTLKSLHIYSSVWKDCYGREWWLGLILRYVDKWKCLKNWEKATSFVPQDVV